jgi:hypothetical protein
MKIFISLIILGSLAFLVSKFGYKKTIEEIEDKASEAAAALKYAASSDSNSPTDNAPKQDTTQLDKDKASLAALQNDAGNKDLLRRIGILQGQNKWGVKDENGFYYSVDSTGVVFSGSNSTDEYDTMLQQQTDYNTKVAALTKSITGETPAENKPVEEGMGGANGLEIPLEIKLLISAIKSKFSLESVDEDEDNGNENSDTDNDDADYHNNYNGGNNGGNDNGGGGGGNNNNNPYPFANTVLPSAVVTAPIASTIPTGSTLANILSQPITMGTLHPRINLTPFNVTPTPTPVINPVVANTPPSTERQAQPTSQRHSGHHYHNHRRH